MSDRTDAQFFRANVGAMILDDTGAILAFERIDRHGFWQMPQGGLDVGEEPATAALREVAEETGLEADDLEPLGECPGWLAYELPEGLRRPHLGRGQVQKWFCYRLVGDASRICLDGCGHPEFRAWRWMRMEELMRETTPFRVPVYEALASHFRRWLAGLLIVAITLASTGCGPSMPPNDGSAGGIRTDTKSISVDKPVLGADGRVSWAAVRIATLDGARVSSYRMVAFYDTDGDAKHDDGELFVARGETIPAERRQLRFTIPAAPGGPLARPVGNDEAIACYVFTFQCEDGSDYLVSGRFDVPAPR